MADKNAEKAAIAAAYAAATASWSAEAAATAEFWGINEFTHEYAKKAEKIAVTAENAAVAAGEPHE
jgi:hypothetical protein